MSSWYSYVKSSVGWSKGGKGGEQGGSPPPSASPSAYPQGPQGTASAVVAQQPSSAPPPGASVLDDLFGPNGSAAAVMVVPVAKPPSSPLGDSAVDRGAAPQLPVPMFRRATAAGLTKKKSMREGSPAANGSFAVAKERDLDDPPRLLEFLLERHRVADANLIMQYNAAEGAAKAAKHQLDTARMDDDRLEEAIVYRDEMRVQSAIATDRALFAQFVVTFPHISSNPLLREPIAEPHWMLPVTAAIDNVGGVPSAVGHPSVMVALEAVQQRNYPSTVTTPSEVLLLVCIMEVSRAVMRLCTACVQPVEGGESESGSASPAPSSPRGAHSPPRSSGSSWESALSANLKILRADERGQNHLKGIATLFSVARYTTSRKVGEDIRAHVSTAMAELMCVLDRVLGGVIPTVRTVKDAETCELSGMNLEPGAVVMWGGVKMHNAVAQIWTHYVSKSPPKI